MKMHIDVYPVHPPIPTNVRFLAVYEDEVVGEGATKLEALQNLIERLDNENYLDEKG